MPSLGYWKIRGLAQPIRLLLHYAGEDYEEVFYEQGDAPEYSREAWTKVKDRLGLPFANLPYYVDGDIKITQSNAILRHIARKHKLVGATEAEMAAVDMMLEQAMDFRNVIVRLVYNPNYEELKVGYFSKLPETLQLFDNYLKGRQWFAGQNLTVCDFPMYELLDQNRIMQPGCLDKFDQLKSFMSRFEALPNIKKYMESDKFIKRPINNKVAMFK